MTNHFIPLISRNANSEKPSVYVYDNGEENRTYYPANPCLQEIARKLQIATEGKRPWESYITEGLQHLQVITFAQTFPLRSKLIRSILQTRTDNDFTRPAASTDKLYMNIGNREVIEVQHPQPSNQTNDNSGLIRLHLGPIGCGKDTVRLDAARVEFARKHSLLATDVEMSSVLDSIIGNCRDSFILVKGETGASKYSM